MVWGSVLGVSVFAIFGKVGADMTGLLGFRQAAVIGAVAGVVTAAWGATRPWDPWRPPDKPAPDREV